MDAKPRPDSAFGPSIETPLDNLIAEANRQVAICNGCRYCEGYCAVFPAMERLPLVEAGDLTYLANLCHDCRACFQACMYAPPHPFAVQIPTLLSTAREESYRRYARPRFLARAFGGGPLGIAALTVVVALLYAVVAWLARGATHLRAADTTPGSFYHVVPYAFMFAPGLVLTIFVVLVVGVGFAQFWRDSTTRAPITIGVWLAALHDVATLKNLEGGGGDCYYPDAEHASSARRILHHLTSYGFLAAFISTCLAAVEQDILGRRPPYPYLHPVVLFGLVGGIGMAVGTTGLIVTRLRSTELQSPRETSISYSFLVALDAAAVSGLALLALRGTDAMGALLVLHLGALGALYLTAPYGKAVHGLYRAAAVLRSAAEEHVERPAEEPDAGLESSPVPSELGAGA